jgi:hypothetical protein
MTGSRRKAGGGGGMTKDRMSGDSGESSGSDNGCRMQTGLLWFDDNPARPVSAKIERAAQRYRERFGCSPNLCYVHPRTLASARDLAVGLQIATAATVQPNSFWIGVKSTRTRGTEGAAHAPEVVEGGLRSHFEKR